MTPWFMSWECLLYVRAQAGGHVLAQQHNITEDHMWAVLSMCAHGAALFLKCELTVTSNPTLDVCFMIRSSVFILIRGVF